MRNVVTGGFDEAAERARALSKNESRPDFIRFDALERVVAEQGTNIALLGHLLDQLADTIAKEPK